MKSILWARKAFFLGTLAALLCLSNSAQATLIEFVATDLPNTVSGEDLWRYDYTVKDRAFLQSDFFDIYFDPLLYGTLELGALPGADWDLQILQQPSVVNFPPFDKGIFDALAFVDNPDLANTFAVTFIYLGPGTPGSQPFEIYDSNVNLVESGFTTPAQAEGAIPEPASGALLLFGIAAFGIKYYRACKT